MTKRKPGQKGGGGRATERPGQPRSPEIGEQLSKSAIVISQDRFDQLEQEENAGRIKPDTSESAQVPEKVTFSTNLSHRAESKTSDKDIPRLEESLSLLGEHIQENAQADQSEQYLEIGSPTHYQTVEYFDNQVSRVEQELGVTFKDQNLLRLALTYKGADFPVKREKTNMGVYEQPKFVTNPHSNLETYGDMILATYVENTLMPKIFAEYNVTDEGWKKHIQDTLNGNLYLTVVASKLNLDLAIRMSPQMIADQRVIGKAKTGKGHIDDPAERQRRALSDPMEALFGAVYLNSIQTDGGESFENFVTKFFYPHRPEKPTAENFDQDTRLHDLIMLGHPKPEVAKAHFERLAKNRALLKIQKTTTFKTAAERNAQGEVIEEWVTEPQYEYEKDPKTGKTIYIDGKPLKKVERTPDGTVVTHTVKKPVFVQATNADGEPLFLVVSRKEVRVLSETDGKTDFDQDGNPIYIQATDKKGEPAYEEEREPVFIQKTDETGAPVFDDVEEPKYVQLLDDKKRPKTRRYKKIKYKQQKDHEGNLLYTNSTGTPLYEEERVPVYRTYIAFSREMFHNDDRRDQDGLRPNLKVSGDYPVADLESTNRIGSYAGRMFKNNTLLLASEHNVSMLYTMPSSASDTWLEKHGAGYISLGEREKPIEIRRKINRLELAIGGIFEDMRIRGERYERGVDIKIWRKFHQLIQSEEFVQMSDRDAIAWGMDMVEHELYPEREPAPRSSEGEQQPEEQARKMASEWCVRLRLTEREKQWVTEKVEEFIRAKDFRLIPPTELRQTIVRLLNTL